MSVYDRWLEEPCTRGAEAVCDRCEVLGDLRSTGYGRLCEDCRDKFVGCAGCGRLYEISDLTKGLCPQCERTWVP